MFISIESLMFHTWLQQSGSLARILSSVHIFVQTIAINKECMSKKNQEIREYYLFEEFAVGHFHDSWRDVNCHSGRAS